MISYSETETLMTLSKTQILIFKLYFRLTFVLNDHSVTIFD